MDARTEGFAAMLGATSQNERLTAAKKLEKHLEKPLKDIIFTGVRHKMTPDQQQQISKLLNVMPDSDERDNQITAIGAIILSADLTWQAIIAGEEDYSTVYVSETERRFNDMMAKRQKEEQAARANTGVDDYTDQPTDGPIRIPRESLPDSIHVVPIIYRYEEKEGEMHGEMFLVGADLTRDIRFLGAYHARGNEWIRALQNAEKLGQSIKVQFVKDPDSDKIKVRMPR